MPIVELHAAERRVEYAVVEGNAERAWTELEVTNARLPHIHIHTGVELGRVRRRCRRGCLRCRRRIVVSWWRRLLSAGFGWRNCLRGRLRRSSVLVSIRGLALRGSCIVARRGWSGALRFRSSANFLPSGVRQE